MISRFAPWSDAVSISTDDLQAFHRFAEAAILGRRAESLHELVDLWEMEHPLPAQHDENVAAVRAALMDMDRGDQGRPAALIIEELRTELASRRTT
jgi:hypothetical protein